MSFAEMKEQVWHLTEDQRHELAVLLDHVARRDDPEWLAELDRRADRVQAGHSHGAAELEALHDRLKNEGR